MRKRLRKKMFRQQVVALFVHHQVPKPTWKWIDCWLGDDFDRVRRLVEIVSCERFRVFERELYETPLIPYEITELTGDRVFPSSGFCESEFKRCTTIRPIFVDGY